MRRKGIPLTPAIEIPTFAVPDKALLFICTMSNRSFGFIHFSRQNDLCINVGFWNLSPHPEKEKTPRLLYRISISQWVFKSKVHPRPGHPARDEKHRYNSGLINQKFSNDFFSNLDVIKSQKGISMGHSPKLGVYLSLQTATTADSVECPNGPRDLTQNFLQPCRRQPF